jgi:hypothetical protein
MHDSPVTNDRPIRHSKVTIAADRRRCARLLGARTLFLNAERRTQNADRWLLASGSWHLAADHWPLNTGH